MTEKQRSDFDLMFDQACKQALWFIKGGNPALARRTLSTTLGVAVFVGAYA